MPLEQRSLLFERYFDGIQIITGLVKNNAPCNDYFSNDWTGTQHYSLQVFEGCKQREPLALIESYSRGSRRRERLFFQTKSPQNEEQGVGGGSLFLRGFWQRQTWP